MQLVRLLAVTVLALSLAGCSGANEPSASSSTPGELVELKSLDTLEAAFAEGNGKTRLLLLLSPT